jgi:uncharacterized integral membrane protein (TIGR00697 family)
VKKTYQNLQLLGMLFGISLVISNVVTGKLIYTGISLFGTIITLPGAAVCYAITFLITDIVGELWGKEEANLIVRWGMIGQILATLLIIFTQYLPAADPDMQTAYVSLLGQNWIFVVGSLVAYIASQSWDVFVFHKLRDKYKGTRGRWLWNNASTLTSQIIDTVLFIGISFGIGFGWLWNSEMHSTLAAMMVGQYLFKAILALIDTPFFYFFTRERN